jgi:GSCFA family
MTHPYEAMPPRAFWSRSVSAGFDPAGLLKRAVPLVGAGEKVMSAGSCFAAHLVPYLEQHGLTYLRTEYVHPFYRNIPPESLGYGRFSAGYGNVYTARQMLQLLRRSHGRFRPLEDRWHEDGVVVDPFRPGLKYAARSGPEFDALTAQHLAATAAAFQQCGVLIFTLGLTEAWVSKEDGSVFPSCPGTIAGTFDPAKHAFCNFKTGEIIADLNRFIAELRAVNPKVRLILTVSPVPLVATASGNHVLLATIYSKSVLRVAAEEVVRGNSDVTYFPAYEIVTGPQAPERFFEADRRSVNKEAVDLVMYAFLHACGIETAKPLIDDEGRTTPIGLTTGTGPDEIAKTPTSPADLASAISARVAAIECEEASADLKRQS